MKAAVFTGSLRPLEIREVPAPEPGPGELLVKVAGCGICHTDLHYLDHGVPTFKKPPLILGHEPSGTVASLGAGLRAAVPAGGRAWREGDRVLLPAVLSCGNCGYCREGRENLCAELRMFGNNMDGAFAEYVVVPARDAFALPDELPLVESSIIADALSTPFHAVRSRARVRAGEVVAVLGCGGVGLGVVQCAAAVGSRVIAIDVSAEKLALAARLGADVTLDPGAVERLDRHVKSLTGGGVDVAFEAIGTPATIQGAYALLRKGGRLCVIGYSREDVTLSAARLMYYELEVVGSLGCPSVEYPPLIELVRRGRLQLLPLVSGTVPLEEINAGFDRLRRGEGVRWVVAP